MYVIVVINKNIKCGLKWIRCDILYNLLLNEILVDVCYF